MLSGEIDTLEESCVFQRLVKQAADQSWAVEAACSGSKGNVSRTLKIERDKRAGTVKVSNQDGSTFTTVDRCGLPYGERLKRELNRLAISSTATAKPSK